MAFVCETCGNQYVTKAKLTDHSRYHSSELVECEECGMTFVGKSLLKDHKRIHKKIKCKVCDMDIALNSKLYHEKK